MVVAQAWGLKIMEKPKGLPLFSIMNGQDE
jgi:hypothetical protein